ncbi:hypothetical protein L6279_02525, partial [Candidatus Parcubacteria bacterium]|nr:hypothetical protein [Candidatus Parcubacteria bacterium]
MLPKINSKIRRIILTFYFTNPDSKYYLRELSKVFNIDAGNLSREMKGLVKGGIFSVEEKGKQKYYFLNK